MLVGGVLNLLVIFAFSQVRYSWADLGFQVGYDLVDFRRGYWGARLVLARAAVLLLFSASFLRNPLWYRALNTAAILLVLGAWFCFLWNFADWVDPVAIRIFFVMCAVRALHLSFAGKGKDKQLLSIDEP